MIAVYMYAAKALINKVNRFWTTNRKQKVLGTKNLVHSSQVLLINQLRIVFYI